jgi:hypothetical protein
MIEETRLDLLVQAVLLVAASRLLLGQARPTFLTVQASVVKFVQENEQAMLLVHPLLPIATETRRSRTAELQAGHLVQHHQARTVNKF